MTKPNPINDTDKRILHLTLKSQWYDMIASGEKKEEYRDVKQFWIRRFLNWPFALMCNNVIDVKRDAAACPNGVYRPYTHIQFRNGYSKDARTMLVELKDINIGYGKSEWGAGDGEYFVLTLGNIKHLKK